MDILPDPPAYSPDGNCFIRPLIHCWNRTYRRQVPRMLDTDALVLSIYGLPALLLLTLSTFGFVLTSTLVGMLALISEVALILPVSILTIGTLVLIPSFHIDNKVIGKILYWIALIIKCIAVFVGLTSIPSIIAMGIISSLFIVSTAGAVAGGWCLFWSIYASSVLLARVHKKSEPFTAELPA